MNPDPCPYLVRQNASYHFGPSGVWSPVSDGACGVTGIEPYKPLGENISGTGDPERADSSRRLVYLFIDGETAYFQDQRTNTCGDPYAVCGGDAPAWAFVMCLTDQEEGMDTYWQEGSSCEPGYCYPDGCVHYDCASENRRLTYWQWECGATTVDCCRSGTVEEC